MPTDTSQQIATLESRLANLEEATQLFAQEINKTKEREQSNKAQVREELNKAKEELNRAKEELNKVEELNRVKERALKRRGTLSPQFGLGRSGRNGFAVNRTRDLLSPDGRSVSVIERAAMALNVIETVAMALALPHGDRLTSISIRGNVLNSSSETRVSLKLRVSSYPIGPGPGVDIAEFEIETGAGLFVGGKEGLDVTIDNSANWYQLELIANWIEPQGAEVAPIVVCYNLELG